MKCQECGRGQNVTKDVHLHECIRVLGMNKNTSVLNVKFPVHNTCRLVLIFRLGIFVSFSYSVKVLQHNYVLLADITTKHCFNYELEINFRSILRTQMS